MDKSDRQADFLLAEYKQIHESIAQNNATINHSFQLMFSVAAAGVGAVMFGLSQHVAGGTLVFFSACICSLLLLFASLGSLVLMHNHRGLVNRLAAINSIRKFFLDLQPENEVYFRLPAGSVPALNKLSSKSGLVFAALGVVMLSVATPILWGWYFRLSLAALLAIGGAIGTVVLAAQFFVIRWIPTEKKTAT